MPIATAVWLIDNTKLTFDQISHYCNLSKLEVQSISDGCYANGVKGINPIISGQLTKAKIEECEKNPNSHLEANPIGYGNLDVKISKKSYTPVAERYNKPFAVLWFVKNYPTMPDQKIVKLIGTTLGTIRAVRSGTHRSMSELTPKDPVVLGFCSQSELSSVISKLDLSKDDTKEENNNN